MLFLTSTIASALFAATLVSAQNDPNAKITKPALRDNLDYLHQGLLDSLPETEYTKDQWGAGWIPQECKTIVTGGVYSDLKFDVHDIEVYNVHYSDCGDAWVFCHHKNSPISIDSMARQFSKLPIQMREWIRHVIDVPSDSGWAFEYDGTVTFVNPSETFLAVIIHETGHSLDLSGAYADKPVSSSQHWWDNFNQDPNVPDNYAQTNMIENVAQQTVVSVYNENVNGGFGSVEPNWNNLFHQYSTLIGEANDAGQGNGLFKPGQQAACEKRLPPSAPVPMDGSSKTRRDVEARRGVKPNVELSVHVKAMDTGRKGDHKHSNCSLTW